MFKTAPDPAQAGKARLSIAGSAEYLGGIIGVLAAAEPQKTALVSSSSKVFPYDCPRTCIRAQFSLTQSFMKFSTYLPFCTARAEAVPSPLFSFVGRLKAVCFCLLHVALFYLILGSSTDSSSALGSTWQLITNLFWLWATAELGHFWIKLSLVTTETP